MENIPTDVRVLRVNVTGTCYRIHERLKVEILSVYLCATKSVEPLIFSPFFGRSQSYLNGISKF